MRARLRKMKWQQSWLWRNSAAITVVCAILSTMLTYGLMTGGISPLTASEAKLQGMVILNLLVLLVLLTLVVRRISALWGTYRQGMAGAKLQTRIVLMFSLVTILPTVLVSVFSALFFNLGIQAWFNERVNTVLQQSLAVAESYLNEHRENLRNDAIAMGNDLNEQLSLAFSNPIAFNNYVTTQASLRSLSEVIVFHRNRIIAQGKFSFSLAFERLPQAAIDRAEDGEVVFLTSDEEDKVRMLIRLNSVPDTYLLVGRLVDSKVLNHMNNTQGTVREYEMLRGQINRLQVMFTIVFLTLALLLLLAAVWYGMHFATKLIRPISSLVTAAERVRGGDFSAKVEVDPQADEIATLARVFNRMTDQLEAQRAELLEVNRRLDDRRRFTEAVLAGVSAGVAAVDENHRITLCNPSAQRILRGVDSPPLEGVEIEDALPGVHALLQQAEQDTQTDAESTLEVRRGGVIRSLHVRVSAERAGGHVRGFIVTFDDMTQLVSAQRSAAWADVARRVAHEIKNPLTPIQLAAERLKRKYLSQVGEAEADSFSRLTETITRHVGDIGRIVEEFSSFARMPLPVFAKADLLEILRANVFSQQNTHPNIQLMATLPEGAAPLVCDERQLNQLIGNLLKNAAEALEQQENARIDVLFSRVNGGYEVQIDDNGPGFKPELLEKLFEPYVTTRVKGTGLGLAIAKKIVDDHRGKIKLSNKPEGGARVTLFFSVSSDINAA